MKTIKVGKTRVALVDDEDAERLRHFTYYYSKGYAFRMIYEIPDERGTLTTTTLQRDVMQLAYNDGKQVRTLDGNKLNCQKSNLVVRSRKTT